MRILFVELNETTLFSFRKELLDELIAKGHDIHLAVTMTKRIFDEYGRKVSAIYNVPLNLKDTNPLHNIRLRRMYRSVIRVAQPELIISYTIKPNIYCGYNAEGIPMIANITGLGNMFKKDGLLSKIGVNLYRKSFRNVDYVFFQNKDSKAFFEKNGIPINDFRLIPGSGVNSTRFAYRPIADHKGTKFLFASRALREKGFDLLIEAIPLILEKHPDAQFNFMLSKKEALENKNARKVFADYSNSVRFLPRSNEMEKVYWEHDFLVSPSFYREGISNVLLESLSCGRPIITTNDNPGCMEVLVDGENGLGVASRSLRDLVNALERACAMPKKEIEAMGARGREFVKEHFERRKVIDTYLSIIEKLEEGKAS